MIRAGLGALLSHWRRRPFQLLTLMIGLATATALWSGVQAINAEARKSYDAAASGLAAGTRPSLTAPGGIDRRTYVALRRAGWPVTPVLEGRIDAPGGSLRLLGIDPFTLPAGDLPTADTSEADAGGAAAAAFITPPGQLLVAPETRRRLAGADLPPRVAATGVPPDTAYADIGTAQKLLGQPENLGQLLITGPPSRTAPPLAEIAPGLTRQQPEATADVARLTDSFHLNLTAFGLLSFAVGLFIVRGAVGLAFEQRRPVFRTLRALGLSRRLLVALLAGELLLLALVAGLLGVALGWLIATLLIPDVAATLRGLYGADVPGTLTLAPAWWLSGIAIAVLGTAIAAAASLWQVARLPLLAPAQPRAWARASESALRLQALAALLCLAVAAGAWATGGLVGGFGLLGGLLLAAALVLPLLLHAALGVLSRTARGPLSEWFWADARQQLPGLSLALMALLLALAANIGVGTMVSSFRLTFTGWLDQRLAAELYVRADSEAQADEIARYLRPRVDRLLPIRSADVDLAGTSGALYGVADDPTYSQNWPLIAAEPDVWDRIADGEAALVNEQLARRDDLWPGATVVIDGWEAPVAGVYSDYGNPRPEAIIGLDRFDRTHPDAPDLRYGVRVDPGKVAELREAIIGRFGLPPDQVSDQASVKRVSLSVFERTFAVTGALNILTLGVAGLAILTSLLTLAGMRQPQLAPVWALGLTRIRLARLELLRALLLAGLTFAAALPVGLVLAWVLLSVINVEAFGWKLPLHLFPLDWLRLLALSLLAAGLAAAIPARRLARTPPAELLKVFAHER